MMLATIPFMDRIGFDKGEIIGYTTMVLAFLMVFFGIRSYRDTVLDGTIGFGRAFQVGILITLIASVCYVATWQVDLLQAGAGLRREVHARTCSKRRRSRARPSSRSRSRRPRWRSSWRCTRIRWSMSPHVPGAASCGAGDHRRLRGHPRRKRESPAGHPVNATV